MALSSGTALAGGSPDAIKARGSLVRGPDVVRQVGNDGESHDRHVGPNSLLEIDRGVNRLWTQGGIQYAPPLR